MTTEATSKLTGIDGNLPVSSNERWAVVLAGGDGTRLRDLTRLVSGDARPKQFCGLFGKHSLLAQTCQRAQRSISADRILIPVSSSHHSFYTREPGIRPSQRIVQPCNKGTAPAIVHSLLSIERHSRYSKDALVAVLPSDHHYSDEMAFTATLESAFNTAARHGDSVVLLGSPARSAQPEYGWIEPGAPLGDGLCGVGAFREKPSSDVAIALYEQGALWNTFVMVGRVGAFLQMIAAARTGLLRAFPPDRLWSGSEVILPAWLYDGFYAVDFSRDVLSLQTPRLIALKMENVEWNDLGRPEGVMDVLRASGLKPWWMKEWHALRRPPGVATAPLSGTAAA